MKMLESDELWEFYQHVLVVDFLRYFIPASGAFVFVWVLLKKPLMHRFIQTRWPRPSRLWSEFAYSMSTVFIFSIIAVGVFSGVKSNIFYIYSDISEYGYLYFFVSILIMLLFHDAYFYWTHRWMHHPKIFRHVHKVHHQSTNPSPWAAYSFHPIEAVIQGMVFPIILSFLPVHKFVVLTFLTYMILRNVWGHLGFELLPKKFITTRWLNWHTTTTHHNMHHELFNTNYGLYFTWWDKWCGTEHKKYRQRFNEVVMRKVKTKELNG